LTVKLYAVINLTMKAPKCAHPFQTNKTTLVATGIFAQILKIVDAELSIVH
jgi:hypothetical protein